MRLMCRHCCQRLVTRPRGLCWGCFYTPAVRSLYFPTSIYAKRGVPDFRGDAPLPARPTNAEPGSAEKLAVMAGRASRGEQLHHPADIVEEEGVA